MSTRALTLARSSGDLLFRCPDLFPCRPSNPAGELLSLQFLKDAKLKKHDGH